MGKRSARRARGRALAERAAKADQLAARLKSSEERVRYWRDRATDDPHKAVDWLMRDPGLLRDMQEALARRFAEEVRKLAPEAPAYPITLAAQGFKLSAYSDVMETRVRHVHVSIPALNYAARIEG